MTERDKLGTEILAVYPTCSRVNTMVDFILADRKRIVEPLVKFKAPKECSDVHKLDLVKRAILKTVSNAGVE